MNNKMREEFKIWHDGITGLSVEFDGDGIPVSIGSTISGNVTIGMWLAWRASRESLCVELPSAHDFASDSCGLNEIVAFNFAISVVDSKLKSVGIKCK